MARRDGVRHRDSILTTSVTAAGRAAGRGADHDVGSRFYRDLFADTGGVPVPGDVTSGASINHPDVDLADPEWNTSDCAWHTMYYGGNYPRLQGVKLRWDPGDVFHHALSIRQPRRMRPAEPHDQL